MMMLHLYVLQHQWIVITLLVAVALVLVFCLTYQAMWLPRGTEGRSEHIEVKDVKSFFTWITQFMPWVLILVIIAAVAFTIVKVVENARIPPNW
jgi:ABC-type multidrug transport system permease subunit